MAFLVATTSLPAVDRPNADRWNAARSRQKSQSDRGKAGSSGKSGRSGSGGSSACGHLVINHAILRIF